MDHLWVAGGAEGEFPDFPDRATLDRAVASQRHLRDPFPQHDERPAQHRSSSAATDFRAAIAPTSTSRAPGFGAEWKKALLDPVVSVALNGFGECLPYDDNYVEIDRDTVDVYGIPVLRIHMTWGENEKAMIPDMAETAAEMLDAAGARNIRPFSVPDRVPGYGIHELGVARMGRDPRTSVLNQFQRAHDVGNVFVMDGAELPVGRLPEPDADHHGARRAIVPTTCSKR